MWFTGGVAQAVTESRTRKAVFGVFAYDEGDDSKKLQDILENQASKEILSQRTFVTIKVARGSEEFKQFSQLFPVVKIPCVYFIGKNGIPLDVITGVPLEEVVVSILHKVIEKNRISYGDPPSSEPVAVASPAVVRDNSGADTAVVAKVEGATAGASPGASGSSSASTSTSTVGEQFPPALSIEEKMERAQQLLDKRRMDKEREELEKQTQQEKERRRVGQELQKFKEWQSDEDRKKLAEERKRDRDEERKARERVLAQIEQDRKERAARFQAHKQDVEDKELEQRQKELEEERKRLEIQAAEQSQNSRLQFRLPDGSSAINTFSADANFAEVRAYVTSEVVARNPSVGQNFKLCTLYPRRTFGPEVDSQTLRELQLAPSAVLLILPRSAVLGGRGATSSNAGSSSNAVASGSTGVMWLFWTALSPIIVLIDYLKFFLFGTPRSAAEWRGPSSPVPPPSRPAGTTNPSAGDAPAGGSGVRRRNAREGGGNLLREEGNVRKFANPDDVSADDDDDENGTWNGNSTQQL